MVEIPGIEDLVLLDAGGNGSVYSGRESGLDRRVAVKVMRTGIAGGERRFDREVRAMGRLSEVEAVAPIYRAGVLENGQPFFVMPIYKRSLQDVIENGPMEIESAIRAMSRVAGALVATHELGVLHLDLKPSNVLLDAKDETFVADFGVAEFMDASVSLSGAMMTPQFAPPERFHDAKPTEAADVYALGATLFAVLVGHPPFSTHEVSSPAAVMMRIVQDPVPVELLPQPVPEHVVAAISASMAKDPVARPTALEFMHMLSSPVQNAPGDSQANSDSANSDSASNRSTTKYSVDEFAERSEALDLGPSQPAPETVVVAQRLTDARPASSGSGDEATVVGSDAMFKRLADPTVESSSRRGLFAFAAIATVLIIGVVAGLALNNGDAPTQATPATPQAPTTTNQAASTTTTQRPTTTTQTASTTTAAPEFLGQEITVALFDDGPTEQVEKFTSEFFEAETGLTVNFVPFSDQQIRDALAAGSGEFDAIVVGPTQAPLMGGVNGWIQDLTPLAEADADFNLDDLLPSIRSSLSLDGALYGVPIFGESSFLMYNREIMDEAGIVVPENPTWEEVAEIAAAVDSDDVAGICLRGRAGWSGLNATLTSVVNTFGGTWWEANADGSPGAAQINQPDSGFRAATEFYVDLVQTYGQADAANSNFTECFQLMRSGGAAMWYGPTIGAGFLESVGLTGNLGVARAPTGPADTNGDLAAGWLWAWSFAIPEGTEKTEAVWEFISWATSEEFINIVGENDGWLSAPPGTRASTYENPEYLAVAGSFASGVLDQINSVDPLNPGTTPRPGLHGTYFIAIPEFQDISNRCTLEISAAIAGTQSVDAALDACQEIASEVSR